MFFRSQRFDHVLQGSAQTTGRLTFQGALLLAGGHQGPIVGQGDKTTLVVKGQVTGDVSATTVFVEGQVTGNVHAHTLVVKSKGAVKGNIQVRVLHLEEGGRLGGAVETLAAAVPVVTEATRPEQGTASVARQRLLDVTAPDESAAPAQVS